MSDIDALQEMLRQRLGRDPTPLELIVERLRQDGAGSVTASLAPMAEKLEQAEKLGTETKQQLPAGRPPLGERAMTSTERNARARQRLKDQVAELEALLSRYRQRFGDLV